MSDELEPSVGETESKFGQIYQTCCGAAYGDVMEHAFSAVRESHECNRIDKMQQRNYTAY